MERKPWFFSVLLTLLCCSVIFFQTTSRVVISNKNTPQPSANQVVLPSDEVSLPDRVDAGSQPSQDKEAYDEWCEVRDYEDLSGHPVFERFHQWIEEFESIAFDAEQAEYLRIATVRGTELSRTRASVLTKIIRGDPQRALSLAIDQSVIDGLPGSVRENLETWQADFVNLDAVHVCFDSRHPTGLIKRWITFPNGKRMRAWVFGQRKSLQTRKSLSVWGISMGEDMALGETPYRVHETPNGEKFVQLGHRRLSYEKEYEKNFFIGEIEKTEKESSLKSITIRYPMIASSTGLSEYIERKYDLNTTLATWAEAVQSANDRNGRLVSIGSSDENRIVWNLLQSAGYGVGPTGQLLKYAWIGATDNEDQNGSTWNNDTNTTSILEINARAGDWKWLAEGLDVNESGYSNWVNAVEPNNTDKDYAAMDFENREGNWTDLNGSHRLPFVVEYDSVAEPAALSTPVDGYRKVLVIPVRFQDEGYTYQGSSAPLVDEFGNVLYPELQKDSYEPVTQVNLAQAMQQVKDFYLRNSDGSFHLEPVISPTVTIPLAKYEYTFNNPSENLFDSEGNIFGVAEPEWDELGEIGLEALDQAGAEGDDWSWGGAAFDGISAVGINAYNDIFASPPTIMFKGGNLDPATGLPHPNFKTAQVEAVLDSTGKLSSVRVLDPGAYYYSTPEVFVNGNRITGGELTVTVESIAVSWVVISTYGSGGLGFVGAPGSHVTAGSGGTVSAGVIAHELGHNFGLLHSNTLTSLSEKPNSDEAIKWEYANEHSVMGSGGINGDITVAGKVGTKKRGNFGLTIGEAKGYDVASIYDNATLASASITELKETSDPTLPANTFRIYRHDYGSAPLSLMESTFMLELPPNERAYLGDINTTFDLHVSGTGDGASGIIRLDTNEIEILSGGKGFSEEPSLQVVDDQDNVLLTIDPSWIRVSAGTDTNVTATLRNYSTSVMRGLRGISVPASLYGTASYDYDPNGRLGAYWLSYRRNPSGSVLPVMEEYGLTVMLGSREDEVASLENFLVDMNLHTPGDFDDAFLLPGYTYSDYQADTHITTISKGGVAPMEYLNIVVNVGTVGNGEAQAPTLTIDASTRKPSVGEYVELSARVTDANVSDYAYAWFLNEVPEMEPEAFNQPTLKKSFDKSGEYVVRVVVSDMKGGIASKNLVLQVGDYHSTAKSTISGIVRSGKGEIQGARVVIEPAPIVEHTVSLAGSLAGSYLPNANNEPLHYLIDGEKSPDLVFRRGEIHRFTLESSTDGFPLSLFRHPEHEMPKVRLNMLVTPKVDQPGENYIVPPIVNLSGGSSFSNYLTHEMGTILDYQNGLIGNASKPLVVTRPYAKSLLFDTNVTNVRTRPVEKDSDGLHVSFGGRGYDRANAPNGYVHRTSFWEDYNETNATVQVYVDGVGTISPVDSESFLGSIWETRASSDPLNPAPQVLVWGTGSDANATIERYVNPNNSRPYRQVVVHDQGIGFEPNGTMAVIHYPLSPLAMWTFDRHESLFDDESQARFQPSPAWNENNTDDLSHYWSFDEENGTSFADQPATGSGTSVDATALGDIANHSVWGTKGRALDLNGSVTLTLTSAFASDSNFTLSMWLRPEAVDHSFSVGGSNLDFDNALQTFAFGGATSTARKADANQWSHLAIVASSSSSGILYVDGEGTPFTGASIAVGALSTTNFDGLIDEVRIYSRAMTEGEVRLLGGRVFLDLSGNRYHASSVGPDFDMSAPGSGGSSSNKPGAGPNNGLPGYLGDSYSNENHGHSAYWQDDDSYLDLSAHISDYAGINQGSISFWIRTSGRDNSGASDLTVFSASDVDDNQSFFRIMVRDIGVMQLHVANDGTDVAKFYTNSSNKIAYGSGTPGANDWHHVVLVVDQTQSTFWIDGSAAQSLEYADGAGARRAFFSDVENLDFMAIGRHQTSESNATNGFYGWLDDFHIYDRALTQEEITFLYSLRRGREQIPRLEAVVDSIGTINVVDSGLGYKETPEVVFSYGSDANTTAQLAVYNAADTPAHGTLAYEENSSLVYVYHDAPHSRGAPAWRVFEQAYGLAELNATSVEHILWTKDTGTNHILTLPNDRNVTRRYVEYVAPGIGALGSPDSNFSATAGLFGYQSPPELDIELAPTGNSHASGFTLFYLDENESAEIVNGGMGLNPNAFDQNVVRISGKGFRPSQYRTVTNTDFDGSTVQTNVITSYKEDWGRDSGGDLTFNDQLQNTSLQALTESNLRAFGPNGEVSFQDWNQNAGAGEPRIVSMEFNQTVSHVTLENPGFGYSMPVEIELIGGKMKAQDYYQYMSTAQTGANTYYQPLPPLFKEAQIAVQSIDADGGILDFNVTDPGYGYYYQPQAIISGGGGYGATAEVTMGNRFVIPQGGAVVAIGFIDADYNFLQLEENASLGSGFSLDANSTTGIIKLFFDGSETVSSLINKLNETNASVQAIYDPLYSSDAELLSGTGTEPLSDLNLTVLMGVAGASVDEAGRGYFNIDQANQPSASVDESVVVSPEENASLELRLGGSLTAINPVSVNPPPGHMDVWIEIWDRNRSEADIDANEDRATATAKVRNGVIEKVIVTNSGRGYVDPVAYARGVSPKDRNFYTTNGSYWNRHWRCLNMRETLSGTLEVCGHMHQGLYPPEACPGEVDDNFPITADRDDSAIEDWWDRQQDDPQVITDDYHAHPAPSPQDPANPLYSSKIHQEAGFSSRVCGGTKTNFVLVNDPYRTPYEWWTSVDASLVPMVEGGKIRRILVQDGGGMYASTEVAVSGTGGNVDVIPIFDDEGDNTATIFDDLNLFNVEFDAVTRPQGAGQGFVERPWSWDGQRVNGELGNYRFIDDKPIYGPPTKGEVVTVVGASSSSDLPVVPSFGSPSLNDALGDRIQEIMVRSNGLYSTSRTVDLNRSYLPVKIDFDGSHRPDLDQNGSPDFYSASALAQVTFSLSKFTLDENGTFLDVAGSDEDVGTSDDNRYRSLYVEEPSVFLLPALGAVDFTDQNASSHFRLNGLVDYSPAPGKGHFDLYVDDRFPNSLYYGFSSNEVPAFGGKITVTDGLPGMNWAVSGNDPVIRNTYAFTDQNGYYAVSDLDAGLYNVAVFMEDKNSQEITFRPDTNQSLVSRFLYLPGFPDLILQSDGFGAGASRLIWSRDARELSFPVGNLSASAEFTQEQKIIEGIGFGFSEDSIPELTILPASSNTSSATPNVSVEVLVDGSLRLSIIDDENSSKFNPGDSFTISYSSSIAGIDFREDYLYSEISDSSFAGIYDSSNEGSSRLVILPNDGNGSHYVEVPLKTSSASSNADANFIFTAMAYDANGSTVTTSATQWSIHLGYDDNLSEVASLSSNSGTFTNLSLFSSLRRGRVDSLDILSRGQNYTNGSPVKLIGEGAGFNGSLVVAGNGEIIDVNVSNAGSGYSEESQIIIIDENGSGGILKPVFGGGILTLKASMNHNGQVLTAEVGVMASERSRLTEREAWLDLFLDAFAEPSAAWWSDDNDSDGLSNQVEFSLGTNPYLADTDGDGLADGNETNGISINGIPVKTNPTLSDTDGDGRSDFEEYADANQTHPLLADTDGDGLSDGEEILLSLNPNAVDPTATIGGIVFVPQGLAGNLYVTAEANPDPLATPAFSASDLMNASTYPYVYRLQRKALNTNYRVTAFIDVTGDQAYENGEPMAQWEGVLTQAVFNANLLLLDALPVLGSVGWNEEVERGDSFSLSSVFANDFPDSNWTFGQNLTAPMSISFTPSSLKILDFNDSSGIATVKTDAPYGTFDLTFDAVDSVGSSATPLIKQLTILDRDPPSLVVNNADPLHWPYQLPWNAQAVDYYAYDEVDGNITDKVTGGQPAIDVNTIGATTVTLTVSDDFGNETNASFTVEIKDMTAPVISFNGDDVIDVLVGESFVLPTDFATLSDNFENATYLETQLTISGTDSVNTETEGNYTILYSVSDSSGNTGTKELIVRVSPPVHVISGVALDGYLSASAVTFTSVSGNFTKVTTTDTNGSFQLEFSGDEFSATDSNANGLLDAQEGFIIVRGGIDGTTNETFGASLAADANSTVVTPLTTILNALVQEGLSKTEAQSALSLSFGYSNQVDLTHYDPIRAAGEGDENAKQILKSGSIAINLIKQAEAFSSIASPNLEPGAVGLLVAKQLGYASMVIDSNLSSSLLDENFIRVVVESALVEADSSMTYDSEDLQQVALIASISNAAFDQVSLTDLLPGKAAVSLAKIQVAADTEILDEYERIRDGTSSLLGLSSSLSADNLVAMGESFVGLNLYAPSGNSFELSIDQTDWVGGKVLTTLFVSDADGDAVSVTITAGNEDLDGDGDYPFDISESLELSVGDLNDLQALNNSLVSLEFTLSDGKGKQGFLTGKVSNGTVPNQEQGAEEDEPNEADTSTGASEMSSLSIETGDDSSGAIVSNDQPIANLSIISGNPDSDGDGIHAFQVNESDEIIIGDLDDLKIISATDIELILEGTEQGGSSVVLNRTLRISNALSLESVRLNSSSWIRSSWFGDFYSDGSPWVFNLRMGWLYVLPDTQSGFWFWDSHFNSWWWTRSDLFPYAHLHGGNEASWIYLDLDASTVKIYDFNSQKWSTRP